MVLLATFSLSFVLNLFRNCNFFSAILCFMSIMPPSILSRLFGVPILGKCSSLQMNTSWNVCSMVIWVSLSPIQLSQLKRTAGTTCASNSVNPVLLFPIPASRPWSTMFRISLHLCWFASILFFIVREMLS